MMSTSASMKTRTESTDSRCGPLSRLARVEIQSIMQFLSPIELIHLSRCSRILLTDADSDIVWKFQPIYDFPPFYPMPTWTCEDFASLFPSNSLILRHQPTFHVTIELDEEVGLDVVKLIVETIPRIVKLTFHGSTVFSSEEWSAILSPHENLQELYLDCICYEGTRLSDILAYLQPLIHLHTFSFPLIQESDSAIGLAYLPSLTNLMFEDRPVHDDHRQSIASSLIHCEHLTYLDITSLLLKADEFYHVFSSSHLSHTLRELHLSRWWLWREPNEEEIPDHLDPVTIEFFSDTWPHLTHLTRLSLNQITGINFLLPTLRQAIPRTLTHLSIAFLPSDSFGLHLSEQPTPPVLIDLLGCQPQLLVEVISQDHKDVKSYQALLRSHPEQFKSTVRWTK